MKPSAGKRVQWNLRVPLDLAEKVEAALGGGSRNDWLLKAIQTQLSPAGAALAGNHQHRYKTMRSTEWVGEVRYRTYACECGATQKVSV